MKSRFLFTALAIAIFFIAFFFGVFFLNIGNTSEAQVTRFDTNREIVLIYFGCSTCGPSNNPELKNYYNNIKEKLLLSSKDKKINFTTIGISNESSVTEGLTHLEKFDSFNEIAVGNRMSNLGIQNYVWDRFDTIIASATPQIIIVDRTYSMNNQNGELFVHPKILKDSILTRRVGISQFEKLSQDTLFYSSL